MRRLTLLLLLAGTARLAAAPVSLEDALGDFDQSVLTNLDLSALPVLTGLDPGQLQAICRELQTRFQGDYVLELAPWREPARTLLPVLDQHEETRPYAAWLRTRLDYLAVASEIEMGIPAPRLTLAPPPTPGLSNGWVSLPPIPPLNPAPAVQRRAWQEQLKRELLPTRASGYVAQLKPIFVSEGVPGELVWLAEVESGFDPRARSPVGAAGLFQLMPETAQILGLTTARPDERLDPGKSARTAARYLKYLYGKFADWRLTVAAYNAGEGRVRRLLERHGAHHYDEIAVDLPAETQMYVPKVEATILRREGVFLEDLKAAVP